MERASLVVRAIWAACLLVGGLNHARTLLLHGLRWDYGGVAWPSAAYWSSLTVLDPLVAALLFLRPRFGIPCTLVLIVTNVIHNLAISAVYAPEGTFLSRAANPYIISQIGFMIFVLMTVSVARRGVNTNGIAERATTN